MKNYKMSEIKCNQTKLEFANSDTDRFGGNFAVPSDQTKIAYSPVEIYLQELESCPDLLSAKLLCKGHVLCKHS